MKDLKHYLGLITILSIGLSLFLLFDYNRQVQLIIILILAAAYVLWGTFFHSVKREFHWRIFLEYVGVAALASIVVIFLLLRT